MPFTPFHMGPGIFIKAILQGCFSLMIFGWTQIVMDIQPLIVILTGQGHLHGFTHTYIGATLLAIFSALTGKYLVELAAKLIRLLSQTKDFNLSWWVAITSAFMGSYTHVLLDSIMHADIEPYAPFSSLNHLLALLSVGELHQFCLYSGLAGALIYYGVQFLQNKNRPE